MVAFVAFPCAFPPEAYEHTYMYVMAFGTVARASIIATD